MELPLEVKFVVDEIYDYVSHNNVDDMQNGDDVVMPANSSFYFSNDEDIYYRVDVDEYGLTRAQLAAHVIHWLIVRNIHFNVGMTDTTFVELEMYAANLAIHGLSRPGNAEELQPRTRNGLWVYDIDISS